jgi:diaminohydroxyphosphoribosylaminopyrimidine deaminase/5-amino-6-(5-phosphoribosylamino)uracil reductase
MAAALAIAERGVGQTGNNPSVGCVIVQDDIIVGRGWTQYGGRPHAEAMALAQAGSKAAGATIYVTLEPCVHPSERGPACAHLVYDARPARVVGAVTDPDPRTAGQGFARLREAGIEVETGVMASEAREQLAGFFSRLERSRPFVTLKMATSLDGQIAMANGQSRWITGERCARACPSRARALRCHFGRRRHGAHRRPPAGCAPAGTGAPQPAQNHARQRRCPQGGRSCAARRKDRLPNCNSLIVEGGAHDRLRLFCVPGWWTD